MTDQEKPAAVPSVREQQYVVTCEECARQATGALPDFIECGWVVKDGAQYGKEAPVFFCPACVFGLKAVAPSSAS